MKDAAGEDDCVLTTYDVITVWVRVERHIPVWLCVCMSVEMTANIGMCVQAQTMITYIRFDVDMHTCT